MLILTWILIIFAAGAALGLLLLLFSLVSVFQNAPTLNSRQFQPGQLPSNEEPLKKTELTVVVPAYNEAANIKVCLRSILASDPPCNNWRVLLVDDGSTDETVQVASDVASALKLEEGRFRIFNAAPRPLAQRWVGKNWACSRAMELVSSTWVLFVDADVELDPATLKRALTQAIEEEADLLSLVPRINCSCSAEWMVQPIMACLLAVGFPIKAANDPAESTAFAAGPFMLFRRSTYEEIGGHRALADVVIEDLALARRIKGAGFRLRYLLGLDALQLQMYDNFPALWEGWSKNWFLGLDSNIVKAIGASTLVFWMFTGPWLVLFIIIVSLLWIPFYGALLIAFGLSIIGVLLQFILRLWTRQKFEVPLTNWWLMSAGGILVGLLGPTSVWRTLTGRDWTWKGRSLA
ncbi:MULTISPECIES: glycosyltransferase [unclassified Prochlorococcus]|uniref:glycosyltransferase n=1 Tax=unclassified Prochlorococcus TaxID=2627481 RepID=UPI00053374CF|nr:MULTISPECIES: glycosyltransferase family 2 protein [unclassified Prochlorococcus]KGG26106.1 Glycosyl transferase [Prochlorococcus sp. MIT 0702]